MKYDLNELIIIGKRARSMAKAYRKSWSTEGVRFHLYMDLNEYMFDEDKRFWKIMKRVSQPTDKEFLAYSYILGKGVPQDFNKAFEVYPVRENPICRYAAWLNGERIFVDELLFGKEEK